MSSTATAKLEDPLDIIERVRVFAGVPRRVLAPLARRATPLLLEDGGILYHSGDPAEHVYFLAEGRLQVLHTSTLGEPNVVLNTVEPVNIVGELAVLTGGRRTTTVRAAGRSVLYRVDAAPFNNLIQDRPDIALAIARTVADGFLRMERARNTPTEAPLWLVVATPPADTAFVLDLARAAVPYVAAERALPVVLLSADAAGPDADLERQQLTALDPDSVARRVAEVREHAGLVVVHAPLPALTGALRHATGVVAPPGVLPDLRARRIELAASGAPSAERVRYGHEPMPAVAARVARLLLKRAVGVALGGGAARAISSLGALIELRRLGIPIDFVSGASMGAIIGALLLANGLDESLAMFAARQRPRDWLRFVDPGFLVFGLMGVGRFGHFFEEILSVKRIEDLPLPFAAVALDMDTGDEITPHAGSIVDAILASMAFPGLFVPHTYTVAGATAPRRFIDGGTVNNIPIDVIRAMGADRVVAVHPLPVNDPPGPRPGLLGQLLRLPPVHRTLVVIHSQFLAMAASSERMVQLADVAVRPDTRHFGFGEVWRSAEIIEAGRAAFLPVADRVLAICAPPSRKAER
jgi:predicted acylesterase/phospholipase RssA/CRP-like cAMP-binding protein